MVLPEEKRKSDTPGMAPPETASPTGGNQKGLVYAEIEVISVDDTALFRHGYLAENEIKRVRVSALVDSGSAVLRISHEAEENAGLPELGEGTGPRSAEDGG